MNDMVYTLEMKNISIEFPGVKALSDVNFTMCSGEIRAVVGANGAGKSTLMKVLAGANAAYTGEIFLNSQLKEIRTPRSAKNLGIELVCQEVDTALFPYLSVAENIMFNNIVTGMKGRAFINWNSIRKSAREILKKLGLDIDVTRQMSTLTLAQKQMVLIARAVREKCKFLILDEPTAALSMGEVDELFRIVKELAKKENVGVIFISHRLPELFQICESLTIMKDGQVIANRQVDTNLTINEIVSLMLGKTFEENFPKVHVPIGDVLVEAEGLTDQDGKVKNVSFRLRSGEIVGIYGLVGAGKTELCKLLFGAGRIRSGFLKYKDKRITISSPLSAVKHKIALVPEERRKEGILVSEPVHFNLSVSCLNRFSDKLGFVKSRSEIENSKAMVNELGVKTPTVYQRVRYLSGGNQQKVVIGKWLNSDSDIYIMDEPMKGVDVGAKRDIFQLIQDLAKKGKSILYASAEINEILAITDRIYVMYNGEFVTEMATKDASEQKILYYATGSK